MSHGKFTIFERDFLVEFIQDELHRDANQYSTIPSVTDADADEWTDTMIVQYLTENKYDWRLMLDTENNRLWDEGEDWRTPPWVDHPECDHLMKWGTHDENGCSLCSCLTAARRADG